MDQQIYIACEGRKFGAWIDADSRNNGYNSGDIIFTAPYIIESILREEMFCEKPLAITTVTSTTILICNQLLSSADDFYNGAYYYNRTRNFATTISDYTGSTKTLTLTAADTAVVAGDIIEITSIDYANKIDYASIDTIGNTTNGTRKDYKFGGSIVQQDTTANILSRLCFESHCMLFENNTGKYKLVALDTDTATTNLIDESQIIGTPNIGKAKTIFNNFTISYCQNYASNAFEKSITVNELQSTLTVNTFTPADFTPDEDAGIVFYGGSILTSLCGASVTRYKVHNPFDENLIWVHDDTTANALTKKLIEWNYCPKIMVQLTGWRGNSFTTGYKPLLAYELGDQCKVNHDILDPDISSVYIFMVVGKSISTNDQTVTLTLMQMR